MKVCGEEERGPVGSLRACVDVACLPDAQGRAIFSYVF